MQKTSGLARKCVMLGVTAAIAIGTYSAVASAFIFRPCICPMIYAPVLCPNGQVYSNGCIASCAGQTGCVPFWDPILLAE